VAITRSRLYLRPLRLGWIFVRGHETTCKTRLPCFYCVAFFTAVCCSACSGARSIVKKSLGANLRDAAALYGCGLSFYGGYRQLFKDVCVRYISCLGSFCCPRLAGVCKRCSSPTRRTRCTIFCDWCARASVWCVWLVFSAWVRSPRYPLFHKG